MPLPVQDEKRPPGGWQLHVSIVALPECVISTLSGVFDVMNAFTMIAWADNQTAPFQVEIVGLREGPLELASGLPISVQRGIDTLEMTDIVIVPSVLIGAGGWQKGCHRELVAWISQMHRRGAVLCSACSGLFLLAETGAFDGKDATVHYLYARAFENAFPKVSVDPARVLVVSGRYEDLISSGASMTWHDLVLYLISRFVGATAAQSIARMFALQWHQDGLAPYIVFEGRKDHSDFAIRKAQEWVETHFQVANPVEEMVRHSSLTERTFKRRFVAATNVTPLAYVQRLRVEDAKRRLERTTASIDEISWQVGYEEPAFFRRLFKRTTGISPGAYRRRFSIPDFARDRRKVTK